MRLGLVGLIVLLAVWRVGGSAGGDGWFDESQDPNAYPGWEMDVDATDEDSIHEAGEGSHEDYNSSERPPDDMLAPYSLFSIPDITIKLNWVIDEILKGARVAFTDDGELTIPLKDVDKPFGGSGLFKGKFSATGGYFKNPGSLQRTGDATVSTNGSSAYVQVSLGLAEVEAGFTTYKLDILSNIHQTGYIKATVAHNSLSLKLTLTYSPTCNVHLDYVRFDALDGIKFEITGLGAFQSLFDTLSSWLIENFEGTLKTVVNDKLYEKVNEQVMRVSEKICKIIPHI